MDGQSTVTVSEKDGLMRWQIVIGGGCWV